MIKKILAVTLLSVLFAQSPMASFAEPVFSRSQEEWAKLRDNRLEYGEIEGLLEEYNGTILQNKIDYRSFQKEYGKTNEEVVKTYRDMAKEIEKNLQEPDPQDANYISAAVALASAKAQISSLNKSADNALEDAEIKWITLESAKKTLVQVAQNDMISYYTNLLVVEDANLTKQQAQNALHLAGIKLRVGTGVKSSILSAQEDLLKAEQSITKATDDANNVKKKLMVMCGWSYNGNPEIGSLPDVEFSKIEKMNPANDQGLAFQNNYTLRINLKKLANASEDSQKESLQTAIKTNKQNISTALVVDYQNVLAARDAYHYAKANVDVQNGLLSQMQTKLRLGVASAYEMSAQEISKKQADVALAQAKISLFSARENYQWDVNGLAKAE